MKGTAVKGELHHHYFYYKFARVPCQSNFGEQQMMLESETEHPSDARASMLKLIPGLSLGPPTVNCADRVTGTTDFQSVTWLRRDQGHSDEGARADAYAPSSFCKRHCLLNGQDRRGPVLPLLHPVNDILFGPDGRTQRQAGKLLSRPHSFLSKCETGERGIEVFEFLEIAETSKKPAHYFLELGRSVAKRAPRWPDEPGSPRLC